MRNAQLGTVDGQTGWRTCRRWWWSKGKEDEEGDEPELILIGPDVVAGDSYDEFECLGRRDWSGLARNRMGARLLAGSVRDTTITCCDVATRVV